MTTLDGNGPQGVLEAAGSKNGRLGAPSFVGLVLMSPLSFFIFGTQIFYIQHSFVFLCLLYLVVIRRKLSPIKKGPGATIDRLFFAYGIWILLSFFLNSILTTDPDDQLRRLFSLFMSFSLMGAYFLGRELLSVKKGALEQIMLGLFITYSIVIAFKVWSLSQGLSTDLFALRVDSSQRLPHAIAFVSTLAGVLAQFWKKARLFLFAVFVFGVFSVLMSLTRGAYLQIVLGGVFIFFLAIRQNLVRNLFVTIVIVFGIGSLALSMSVSYQGIEQIGARWAQLVDIREQAEEDPSGSFRLKLWLVIVDKLSEVPFRWVTGYGQLGATNVTGGDKHPSDLATSAHSQYLDTIVRDGFVGLILFVLILYEVVKQGFFNLKRFPADSRPLILAHSVALFGVLSYSFFHETFRYPLFGFYFWMYVGMVSQWLQQPSSSEVAKDR